MTETEFLDIQLSHWYDLKTLKEIIVNSNLESQLKNVLIELYIKKNPQKKVAYNLAISKSTVIRRQREALKKLLLYFVDTIKHKTN